MLITHAAEGRPVWVDLFDPAEAEIEEVNRAFSVRVPSRDELSEIESSSRLVRRNNQLYLSMPLLPPGEGDPYPLPLGFILCQSILITVRYSELMPLQQVADAFASIDEKPDSSHVFIHLLEAIVDRAADLLEQRSLELARTSRLVFRERSTAKREESRSTRMLRRVLVRVGRAGQHLSETRDTLLGLQRIAPFVADSADWLPQDVISRLHLVQRDITSLTDFESHLANKVQFLLDAILGFINTEQNEIFKVLTIASVVGIPPTFIASMYGMNFRNMPELSWSWGYEYGLGLIAISTIIPILWFKSRGWW
jgi:magnesium transporter